MAQTQLVHLLLTSGRFSQINGPYKEGNPMDRENQSQVADEVVEFEKTTIEVQDFREDNRSL
jgi:hypothetical protein